MGGDPPRWPTSASCALGVRPIPEASQHRDRPGGYCRRVGSRRSGSGRVHPVPDGDRMATSWSRSPLTMLAAMAAATAAMAARRPSFHCAASPASTPSPFLALKGTHHALPRLPPRRSLPRCFRCRRFRCWRPGDPVRCSPEWAIISWDRWTAGRRSVDTVRRPRRDRLDRRLSGGVTTALLVMGAHAGQRDGPIGGQDAGTFRT